MAPKSVRIAFAVAVLLVSTMVGAGGARGVASRVAGAPAVLVHGYTSASCPGFNSTDAMAGPAYGLVHFGDNPSSITAVSFYQCDSNGADIRGFGPASYRPNADGVSDQNTSIEKIGNELAWYIYNTFTVHGTTITLIGHSMGGLVMRFALWRTALGDPAFPPSLLVQDAITISTPNLGATLSTKSCPPSVECAEMAPSSAFLSAMNATSAGQAPQGANGTDWTAIGGETPACDIVSAASAAGLGSIVHRLIYFGPNPCYTHTGYLSDVDPSSTADLQTYAPGAHGYRTQTGPHALQLIALAARSSYW